MKSGAARLTLDIKEYRERLQRRTGGTQYTIMSRIVQRAKNAPKRIVFPDGDNIKVLRACQIVLDEGIARPILLGSEKKIRQRAIELDLDLEGAEMLNPADSLKHSAYAHEYLELRCRRGSPPPAPSRFMNRRIHFGMMMVRRGDADGLVAGLTAPYPDTIRPALQILGIRPDVRRATGMYMMLLKNDVKFFADATMNIDPDAETLADTAIQVADAARAFEVSPRIAMISFSNFGSAPHPESIEGRRAVEIVRKLRPDLEIDGEVQADIAVDVEKMHELFPFSRLTDEANVLVFPSLAAGNAAYKVLAALGGATAIGPILLGVNKPVTVLPRDANVDTIVSMTAYTVARGSGRADPSPRPSPTLPLRGARIAARPSGRTTSGACRCRGFAGAALARRRAGEVDRRAVERDERLLRLGDRHVGHRHLEGLRDARRHAGQRERRAVLVDAHRELRRLVHDRRRVHDLAGDAQALARRRERQVDHVEAALDRLPARAPPGRPPETPSSTAACRRHAPPT